MSAAGERASGDAGRRAIAPRLRDLIERLAGSPVAPRELTLLAIAIAIGVAIPLAYLLLTNDHVLAGDEIEYDIQGGFFANGQLFYSTTPLGEPHATAWKAPIYPLWVGTLYAVLGESPLRVELAQILLFAPLSILMTWLLARRLFGARTATLAAFAVAAYPLAFEYHTLLYPETMAIPAVTAALILILTRSPSPSNAGWVGALIAFNMLIRPSSVLLFAPMAAVWWLRSGFSTGLKQTAIAVGVAILCIAPWTFRNYLVTDGFVPISVQQAAAYGTFNDEAANDPVSPYAWRVNPKGVPAARIAAEADNEYEFMRELQSVAREYIFDHPDSVPKAMFWNGVSRFWDLRRPSRSLAEAATESRTRTSKKVGLALYYPLLALALLGIWRAGPSRRMLAVAVAAIVVAAAVVFASIGVSRYRAPLEPLIVVLAAAAVASLTAPSPRRTEPRAPSGA